MEHIKKQLDINLNKKGLRKITEASYVCYLFKDLKEKILGEEVDCEATSFKRGVLKIKAVNSVVASEIRFKALKIKDEINKKIGRKVIFKIDTQV